MTKFKKGDRVRVIFRHIEDRDVGINVGDKGTVVIGDSSGDIGVRLDRYNKGMHSCSHLCEFGHGWWFREDNLELIESEDIKDKDEVYVSKAELQHLYVTLSTATNMLHQLLERQNGK